MRTDDLDATIKLLNDMLAVAESVKDKLAITDRLLKCHSLKYKHSDEGKGGKFSGLEATQSPVT